MGATKQGRVKWFNVQKGFGFIRADDNDEIFFHFSSIENYARSDPVKEGDLVTFEIGPGRDPAKFQAIKVKVK
jgi:CspA family cold shock protein